MLIYVSIITTMEELWNQLKMFLDQRGFWGGWGFVFWGLWCRCCWGFLMVSLIFWTSAGKAIDPRNPEDGCRIPCVWKRWWTPRSVSHYQRRTGDNLGCSANEIVAFKGLRGLRKARRRAHSQDFQSVDLRLLRRSEMGFCGRQHWGKKKFRAAVRCLNREIDEVIPVHHRIKMFSRW